MGATPATTPSPNLGYEAAGKQRLAVAVRQLEQLLPLMGAGSPEGADVLKALNILAKHVQPGDVTPAAERNALANLQMKNLQQGQQMAQLRQGGQAPPAGGAPPQPGAQPS